MAAFLVVLAVGMVLGAVKGWFAPKPAYDWPVWVYRVALAVVALTGRCWSRFRRLPDGASGRRYRSSA